MKTKMFSAMGIVCLLMMFTLNTGFATSKRCPNIQLTSPPSNVNVKGFTCGGTGVRACINTFTLSNSSCSLGYTWTFTNTTTGWSCNYFTASGTATLDAWISGSAGDNITLVITSGTATSPTYNFTGVGC